MHNVFQTALQLLSSLYSLESEEGLLLCNTVLGEHICLLFCSLLLSIL